MATGRGGDYTRRNIATGDLRRVLPVDGRSLRAQSGNGVCLLWRGGAFSTLVGPGCNPRDTDQADPSRCRCLYEGSGTLITQILAATGRQQFTGLLAVAAHHGANRPGSFL